MKLAIVLGSTREGRKSPLVREAIMKHSSAYRTQTATSLSYQNITMVFKPH